MTWFKLDDRWHSHRKVIGLSLAARGLWATLGSWCAQEMNGGHVPENVVRHVGGTKKLSKELVDSGLWEVAQNGGFNFHDWHEHQPTKTQVISRREATRLRVQKFRSNGVTVTPGDHGGNAVTNGVGNASPVPSRPVPYREEKEEPPPARVGSDLIQSATGIFYGAQWRHELGLIGMKPDAERVAVQAAISCDSWCKTNKTSVNPTHVLKHWARYAAGNPPMKSVARSRFAGPSRVPTAAEYARDAEEKAPWET